MTKKSIFRLFARPSILINCKAILEPILLKHFFYNLMTGFHRKQGLKTIKQLEAKLVSPQARFAIPFAYRGHGYFKSIEPRQNPAEIESLYRIICELSPKRILEIGTARGGTLYLWTQAAAADATIISVDLPGGKFGGAYLSCRTSFYHTFIKPAQTLKLLRLDSHSPETLDKVKAGFDNQQIDFIFIDGDHTYEGVRTDFYTYGPLVRPGGIIVLHDILARPDLPEIQVYRFWREIKNQYDTKELIGAAGSGRKIVGIGLIQIDEAKINGTKTP